VHDKFPQKKWIVSTLILILWILCSNFYQTHAQVQISSGSASLVSATVPDIESPSIPILISPEDEAILTTSTPTFVWYGSTDNVGIDHYDFWLNGVAHISDISPVDQDTAIFTLVVNEDDNTFSLTIKEAISDGDYTWGIVASDAVSNTATSATWDFSIDTLAPYLSITKIEDETVLITTANSQTLPSEPFSTKHKDPLISGLGEPNTALLIILAIPGQNTLSTTYSIGSGGTWTYQFPSLDKNTLVTLTLIIEDSAGHTNTLTPIQFIYKSSAESTISPTVEAPTTTSYPRPSIYLVALTPTPYPTLRPSEQSPLQPFITLFNRSKSDLVIKQGKDRVTFISEERRPFWEWLSPAMLVLPSLVMVIILIRLFGRAPDRTLIMLILWWFGWRNKQKPDGEVHDRSSLKPLWLIPIEVVNPISKESMVVSVTDRIGEFLLPKIEAGELILKPKWSGLQFPSIAKRPQSVPWHRFYLGEVVSYNNELPWPFIHIPVEQLKKQSSLNRLVLDSTQWHGPLFTIQLVVMLSVILLSPSFLTGIPLLISCVLGFLRYFSNKKKHFTNNTA
jgi:hypothetical protein